MHQAVPSVSTMSSRAVSASEPRLTTSNAKRIASISTCASLPISSRTAATRRAPFARAVSSTISRTLSASDISCIVELDMAGHAGVERIDQRAWRGAARRRGRPRRCPAAPTPARRRGGSSTRSARRCGSCATRSCASRTWWTSRPRAFSTQATPPPARQGRAPMAACRARPAAARVRAGGRRTAPAPATPNCAAAQRSAARRAAAPARRSRRVRRARSAGGRIRGRHRRLRTVRRSTPRGPGLSSSAASAAAPRRGAGRGVFVAQPADRACGGGLPGIGPAVQLGQRAQAEPVVGRHAEGRDGDVCAAPPCDRRAGDRKGSDARAAAIASSVGLSPIQRGPSSSMRQAYSRTISAAHRCGAAAPASRASIASPAAAAQASCAGRRLRMAADREQPRHRGHGLGATCGPATARAPRRGASR